jgi:hypothetical protein
MPLPAPVLDDRSYQQLRDELVQRIPVYTPEWTDHNASDPGITLLELFAFLGENLLYRFNQIPETTELEFLKRLDIPLRPAQPAGAMLAFTTERPEGVLGAIGSEAKAGDLAFETLDEVVVWPLAATGWAKLRTAAPDALAEPDVYDMTVRAVSALAPLPAGAVPDYYRNERVPVSADLPPTDLPSTVDGTLWVALSRGKGFDATKLADGVINLGFVPDQTAPPMADAEPCPGLPATSNALPVEWQISRVAPVNGTADWLRLQLVGDTTEGLTRDGIVRLRLPHDLSGVGVPTLDDPAAAGTGSRPPLLDDDSEAQLWAWVRAYRVDGSDLPKTQALLGNAATARQSVKARPEFLGTGTGQPDQRVNFVKTPVLVGSAVVEVEEPGGWQAWTAVDGFQGSGADDRHFVLDPEAGELRFGNGEQGRVPRIGERLRAKEYRWGGGAAGNVPALAINKTALAGCKVGNPLRARSGADAEAIAAALDRIPGELRRRDRAVTADDFKELALATPGGGVARAECLPRFHAPTATPDRPGIVTVVVWPPDDAKQPDAPLPDAPLLDRVCAWLDARRLVTTELYVVRPTYRKVAVSVALEVKPGFGVEAVRRWVELVLRQYLAPLPPYGPAGQGWPLGRRVHGPELEAAALQVEGVEFLEGLAVAGRNNDDTAWNLPGTVELAPHEVPWLTEIAVVVGPVLPAPGTPLDPPRQTTPVPIPVEREAC